MKTLTLSLALVVAGIIFSGCAGYDIRPISTSKADKIWTKCNPDSGYIFYQPELYFLVAPNTASKDTNNPTSSITVTPIYLPNTTKAYRVTTYNYLAKSGFVFNFNNGWQLTSISDQSDNSTVTSSLVGQLGSALGAALTSKVVGTDKPQKTFLLHPDYTNGIISGFETVEVKVAE